VAFLIIGVLGFVLEPRGGLLLGIFAVDAVHNAVHIIVGVLGILGSSRWPRLYCEVLGIVYLLIGILGFVPGAMQGHMLLGLLHVNTADNILHLVVGAAAAYVGFLAHKRLMVKVA
jgi:hypothetical protein